MSPIDFGLIGLAILFILLAIGLPVGVALLVVSFGGLWYLISDSAAFLKIAIVPFQTVASYDLAVLPMFIFMAQITFSSGLGKDLYDLASKWLGRLPGGLAVATVGACALFSAVSASSVATAVTMGTVTLPEMKRYRYNAALATGCVAAGGTMGILIPPSGMLILYGIITETSIGKLFIAGLVPGLLQAIFYIVAIYIVCRRNPNLGPPGTSFSFREKIMAFKSCGEIIALMVLVLGGLIIGWFTPTEAGAVGAFGAIIFSMIRKRLDWQKFKQAINETVKTTGMAFCILIGAFMFQYFMSVTTIPFRLAEIIGGLSLPPLAVMGCIILMYIILGSAMEEMSMMLITIPVFFPVVTAVGFDAIWFGIIVTRMMQIAMISPPVGINMFVIQGISGESIQTVWKGVMLFLIADVFQVLILLFVPAVVLILPRLMQ